MDEMDNNGSKRVSGFSNQTQSLEKRLSHFHSIQLRRSLSFNYNSHSTPTQNYSLYIYTKTIVPTDKVWDLIEDKVDMTDLTERETWVEKKDEGVAGPKKARHWGIWRSSTERRNSDAFQIMFRVPAETPPNIRHHPTLYIYTT